MAEKSLVVLVYNPNTRNFTVTGMLSSPRDSIKTIFDYLKGEGYFLTKANLIVPSQPLFDSPGSPELPPQKEVPSDDELLAIKLQFEKTEAGTDIVLGYARQAQIILEVDEAGIRHLDEPIPTPEWQQSIPGSRLGPTSGTYMYHDEAHVLLCRYPPKPLW